MWPNPSAVEHVKCAKRYGEMSRVLALFVWPLSIDWPERKCEQNIFTHQTQNAAWKMTGPANLPGPRSSLSVVVCFDCTWFLDELRGREWWWPWFLVCCPGSRRFALEKWPAFARRRSVWSPVREKWCRWRHDCYSENHKSFIWHCILLQYIICSIAIIMEDDGKIFHTETLQSVEVHCVF